MHDQKLTIIYDVNRPIIYPVLFSASPGNIGIFGESKTDSSTLLKNIVARALQNELAVFGVNLTRVFDSSFYKLQHENYTSDKILSINSEVWEVDDGSNKAEVWINQLVVHASRFNKSVLFINNSTPLLKNTKALQYLGKLCDYSAKYGLRIILVAESSRSCSQKILESLVNRFVILPTLN